MKKILGVLLCVWLMFSMTACTWLTKPLPLVFTEDALSITLDDSFEDMDSQEHDACFVSKRQNIAVNVTKEEFYLFENEGVDGEDEEATTEMTLTLASYGQLCIAEHPNSSSLQTKHSLTYFTYEAEVEEVAFTYITVLYASEDAFWRVQFICPTKDASQKQETLFSFAQSVVFESQKTA